jgi:glycosyltransferase involved in cell wall biosynthesis
LDTIGISSSSRFGTELKGVYLRVQGAASRVQHRLQILRLKLERVFQRSGRKRIIATACYGFPIYSQTFVYQELNQLIQEASQLRFLYSKQNDRRELSQAFSSLWHARRKLNLNPEVCSRSYERYRKRMPEKTDSLIEIICSRSGLSREQLFNERHFFQAFAFTEMVEAYRPDYLHSYFFYEGTLFALVASFLLNIPRGVSCYADHMLKDYVLKLVPLHLEQCRLIIATSEQIKRELLRINPSANPHKILVKSNAIYSDHFPFSERSEPETGQPYRIIAVSRIEPKKGLIYLLEAVRLLREQAFNVEAHIIGGVDSNKVHEQYSSELQKRIKELNLSQIIHLEGARTHAEVQKFLASGHLFVAPFVETDSGDKDGIPTSLMEAMASGMPVVATDAGSIAELIENGVDGRIVRQRDATALSETMKELFGEPQKRNFLGRNAARKIREKFDVRECEAIFHDRLNQIVGEPQPEAAADSRTPLVSVITIFFNAEKFLEEAILSVLSQTYGNWELLLIDDGSSDRSTEIAKKYCSQDPDRIRYFKHPEHENRGMSASRNLGLADARGEYICFLDADDVFMPDKLSEQVKILSQNPDVFMVYGKTQIWHSWESNSTVSDYFYDLGVRPDSVIRPPELFCQLLQNKFQSPTTCNALMRRQVFDIVGGFENSLRGMYEDQMFFAKVNLTFPVFVAGKCWARYRQHSDS